MPDQPPAAALHVERPDAPAQRFALANGTFRIGRAPGCDLVVPENHVSKQHAAIAGDASGFTLTDTNSRAGVMVNGTFAQQHRLADGDVIELGHGSPVRITFRIGAAAAPTSAVHTIEHTLAGLSRESGRGGLGLLARFLEFSNKLGGGLAIDEILQNVVDLAIEITRAERGMLIFPRPGGGFDLQVARSNDRRSLPADRLRLSATIVQGGLVAGRANVIQDVADEAELAAAESIVSLELRSVATLPLRRFTGDSAPATATAEVFGLLYLDSRRRHGSFDGIDLRLLERLAHDASSAIENARLYREAEAKKRIELELTMAREVQAALMPERFVSNTHYDIAGICVPCHQLGGDYVDQFDLGSDRQVIVVADVCGKGIAASLLAATLQGALAAEIGESHQLEEIAARVNRVHARLAPAGKFITMVLALLEPDGRATIVDAGHCPALVVRAGGVEHAPSAGIALGLDATASYEARQLHLGRGESLVLYTDGVVECEATGRELFGEQRLLAALRAARGRPATGMLAEITAALEGFRGTQPVSDDLSLVVVQRI